MVYIGKVAVIFSRLGSWRSYPYLLIGIGMAGEAKSQSKSTMTTDRARPTGRPNTEATFVNLPIISQSKRPQKTIDHGIESL